MFYSKKLNLLFIACPKTGSTSIEKYLQEIDNNGETHSITINNKTFEGSDFPYHRVGHARAIDIKRTIGEKKYNNLNVFGMVRHPFEKLISTYFFSREGNLRKSFIKNGEVKVDSKRIRTFLSRLFAKIFPISFWAIIFPMKTSFEYFHDESGNRIVNFLGRTDNLNQDLIVILRKLGVEVDDNIPHVNKSKHGSTDDYFKGFLKYYVGRKYEKDLKLYLRVVEEMKKISNH